MDQYRHIIDDDSWEELLSVTAGAAAVCFQCGVCSSVCPWGIVNQNLISVRSFIHSAQLGFHPQNNDLWYCTTCGQCEQYCPRGVKITEIYRGLRYLAWKKNQPYRGLNPVLWSIFWNNNPWQQPPSQRSKWSSDLKLAEFNPQKHEILYYVGCTTSYDARSQKIAQSLVRIFRAAGVSFGILGEHEPCSGEEILSIGHKPFFLEIAQKTTDYLKSKGVTHLVTTDPHSFDAFTNHYPSHDLPVVQHYTLFLAQLIEDGRLTINSSQKARQLKITYHDPCYLSRHNAVIETPRKLLASIPGSELAEMKNVGNDTICCGGGGGRMWIDTAAGERFSDLRVKEAVETGADILVTACPYCISFLEDSIKSQSIKNLAVMDIAEILALSLHG